MTGSIGTGIGKGRCTLLRKSRGGALIVMHGRSRMTIDSLIPTMPGRSTSGFHRPVGHCLHQARSVVRCWASRMKGEGESRSFRLEHRSTCLAARRLLLACSSVRATSSTAASQKVAVGLHIPNGHPSAKKACSKVLSTGLPVLLWTTRTVETSPRSVRAGELP